MDENLTKVLLGIIGIITATLGASIVIKKTNRKTVQKNIEISGDNSKVVGGDDNSFNK